MFNKKTIRDIDLRQKVVLLRADYNVSISYDEDGSAHILSDFRIRASLPTLRYLIENGAKKIVIISHLGRPNSVETLSQISELEKLNNDELKFSLKPVFLELAKILKDENLLVNSMYFRKEPIFAGEEQLLEKNNCQIEMLENLRFSKDEKRNSIEFAQKILEVSGADIFVQDGFGVVHRAHTSTSQIAKMIPSVAGLLVEKEFSALSSVNIEPKQPVTVVIGGAKISDKLPMIKRFIDKADSLIIGGAIANTFLKTYGFDIGNSKFEEGQDENVRLIDELARARFGDNFREHLILPVDFGVATEFSKDSERRYTHIYDISKDDVILDVGDKFTDYATNILEKSQTIIWNGTLGFAEFSQFSEGSKKIAAAISKATHNGAISVIGGGDTSAFAIDWMNENPNLAAFSLVSTGGGAALELLSGKNLPGIDILPDKHKNLQTN